VREIAKIMRLQGPPCTVYEAHPATANGMRWLVESPLSLAAAIRSQGEGDAREVWEAARLASRASSVSVSDAAAWWLWSAGARGGIGGFKGAHKLRPSVDGFIPSRSALVARIASMPMLQIAVVHADARTVMPQPGAKVYIDPPYVGTQGYGVELPREDVERLALRWHEAGCMVAVSEREPIDLPGAKHYNLTAARTGQHRRSLTKSHSEWLTVLGFHAGGEE
jgi:hypothetical protein